MDNKDLEPLVAGNMVIGHVSEINGADAVGCPEYVPTRHELQKLARYWYDELLAIQVSYFYTTTTGSWESRMLAYAQLRLNRIAATIGRESVDAVTAAVDAEYQARMGADWDVFLNGTSEQIEAVRDRVEAEIHAADGNDSARRPTRCHDLPGQMWLW